MDWSHHYWFVMRDVAKGYPNDPNFSDRQTCCQFYNSLVKLLPNGEAQQDFARILEKFPVEDYAGSKAQLQAWVETVYGLNQHQIYDHKMVEYKRYQRNHLLKN